MQLETLQTFSFFSFFFLLFYLFNILYWAATSQVGDPCSTLSLTFGKELIMKMHFHYSCCFYSPSQSVNSAGSHLKHVTEEPTKHIHSDFRRVDIVYYLWFTLILTGLYKTLYIKFNHNIHILNIWYHQNI